MPWKESRASDERLKFIAEVLSGNASLADLCRRFDISRKTGYKWKNDMKSVECRRWATLDVLVAIQMQCLDRYGSALSN